MNGWVIDEQMYARGKRYELPEEAAGELESKGQSEETTSPPGSPEATRNSTHCGNNDGEETAFLLLRPLSDAEALERESIGIVEWYYLDGQEPAVRRTYDLAAMTEYDYRHCVLDFRLPVREQGDVRLMEMNGASVDADERDGNMALLAQMPPKLAEWVAECMADVNMRSQEQRRRLEAAKKN